jgi:hypothetical protein
VVSAAGTWNLTTVNGSPLPFIAQAASPKVELLSDQLILGASGTFTQTTTVRFTDVGVDTTQTFADAGTYTVNGTAISFRFNSDGSVETGTVGSTTLTVAGGGFSAVYTKQ